MKILVTGGAGRLGVDLVEKLTEKRYDVRAFDIPTADFTRLMELEKVEIMKGDVRSLEDLRTAIRDVNSVFHLAAILPPTSEKNRELTLNVNVNGTQNVVKVIKEQQEDISLFFSSSVMVYGNTSSEHPPIKEDHDTHAVDIYSESKIKCEKIITISNIPYAIFRISGIYSVELFELPKILPFRADQRVNFIDRRDVVHALVSALKSYKTLNDVINIAGDKSWWLKGDEFINRISDALGAPFEANYSKHYTSFDWYDTTSHPILKYHNIPFSRFIKEMEDLGKTLF